MLIADVGVEGVGRLEELATEATGLGSRTEVDLDMLLYVLFNGVGVRADDAGVDNVAGRTGGLVEHALQVVLSTHISCKIQQS